MTANLGRLDRRLRLAGALALIGGAAIAPLPWPWRLVLLGNALYLMGTSLVGTCLGYRLLGRSTCPVAQTRNE